MWEVIKQENAFLKTVPVLSELYMEAAPQRLAGNFLQETVWRGACGCLHPALSE